MTTPSSGCRIPIEARNIVALSPPSTRPLSRRKVYRGVSVSRYCRPRHAIEAAFEKKDRLTAVLLKSKVTAYQCALMRIEAGWPGSLKRFRGTIFVQLTFKIERS